MSISWSAVKTAVGSSSPLYTGGYNGHCTNYGANSSKLDFICYWRVGSWDSSAHTCSITVYAFGRKANTAPSTNQVTLTYYAWGETYTAAKKSITLNKSSGKATYIGSHTFSGVSTDRTASSSNIGFQIKGDSGTTDFSGTWYCREALNFSTSGMSSSISNKTTTSLQYNMSGLVTNRGYSGFSNWEYKKSSASSFTRDTRTNISEDSTTTSTNNTFSGLAPCTQYNLRYHLGARNYNPDDGSSSYMLTFKNKYWESTAYTNAKVATEPTVTTSFVYNGSSRSCVSSSGTGVSLSGTQSATNVGNYTLTATPTAEYNWTSTGVAQSSKTTKSYSWKITAKPLTASDVTITFADPEYVYYGGEQRPGFTLKDGSTTIPSSNYSATYSNNINAGTGKITIVFSGNYSGTIEKTFTIKRNSSAVAPTKSDKTYNGSSQTGISGGSNVTITGTQSATNAGTYTVTATPTSNYAWSDGTYSAKQITWTINPRSLTTSYIETELNLNSFYYDGTAKTPIVVVRDTNRGTTLTKEIDYTISYSNNINVGTALITITGYGNYTDSKIISFEIYPNISTLSYENMSINNIYYENTAIQAVYYGNDLLWVKIN